MLFMFGFVTPAQATEPVTTPPGTFVVDESNVLDSGEHDQLEQQINQLQSEHSATAFLIFVPTFDTPSEPEAWVAEVAEEKQLGTNDNILAIATEDRLYNFVSHSSGPFRQYQSTIDRELILPALSEDDWLGAAEGAVEGLAAAANGELSADVEETEFEEPSLGLGMIGNLLALGALLLIVVAIVAIVFWYRRSKKKQLPQRNAPLTNAAPADPRDDLPVQELRTQAGSALIQADDAIKVAEQEISFAQASYGDKSVEMFQ